MLRNLEHIMGLPELRYESERWKIKNGNTALKFCSRVAHLCLAMLVPFIFENQRIRDGLDFMRMLPVTLQAQTASTGAHAPSG